MREFNQADIKKIETALGNDLEVALYRSSDELEQERTQLMLMGFVACGDIDEGLGRFKALVDDPEDLKRSSHAVKTSFWASTAYCERACAYLGSLLWLFTEHRVSEDFFAVFGKFLNECTDKDLAFLMRDLDDGEALDSAPLIMDKLRPVVLSVPDGTYRKSVDLVLAFGQEPAPKVIDKNLN